MTRFDVYWSKINDMDAERKEIAIYIENAHEMLEVAKNNLANGFYSSSVNRAYYAIFYAANAVLATKKLARNKHSAVISAFRQYFVKTGLIPVELSDIYGRIMGDRELGDYDLVTSIDEARAKLDLQDAKRFIQSVEEWLRKEHWL